MKDTSFYTRETFWRLQRALGDLHACPPNARTANGRSLYEDLSVAYEDVRRAAETVHYRADEGCKTVYVRLAFERFMLAYERYKTARCFTRRELMKHNLAAVVKDRTASDARNTRRGATPNNARLVLVPLSSIPWPQDAPNVDGDYDF